MPRTQALMFVNIAHFLDHYFLLIFPTAALAIAPAWGMGFADVLLYGSPLYAMFALGTLPAGWLGDRMDRMILIALFFLGCGVSGIAVALSGGPISMMAGLGALGLFAAIYHPVGLAHVTLLGLRSGRALAVNGVFGNMGLAGAAVATAFLAQTFGWRAAFWAPGGVSVFIGLVILLRIRPAQPDVNTQTDTAIRTAPAFERPVQRRVFLIVCVSALFGGLIFNAITLSLPKFLDERLITDGTSLIWVGTSSGLVFAVAAFAQLPVGELLDRIGARPILLTLLAAQIGLFVLLSQATGWLAFGAALLLVTSIFAEIPITTWLLGHYLDPAFRSRAVSLEYTLSLGVGSAVVPLMSLLHGRGLGFDVQLTGLAFAAMIIGAAALFLPRSQPRL